MTKRIPRIKFPQRHAKSPASVSVSQTQAAASTNGNTNQNLTSRSGSGSDVPAAPSNTAVGGKASLQPKRTPVSEREIEAILLGGCF